MHVVVDRTAQQYAVSRIYFAVQSQPILLFPSSLQGTCVCIVTSYCEGGDM
jgi:hypothetical protein